LLPRQNEDDAQMLLPIPLASSAMNLLYFSTFYYRGSHVELKVYLSSGRHTEDESHEEGILGRTIFLFNIPVDWALGGVAGVLYGAVGADKPNEG